MLSFYFSLQESLKTIGDEYQKKQATLSAYQEQNRWYETQINSLQRDITSEKSEIENIEKRLANIDPQKLSDLREEKKNFKINKINWSYNLKMINVNLFMMIIKNS